VVTGCSVYSVGMRKMTVRAATVTGDVGTRKAASRKPLVLASLRSEDLFAIPAMLEGTPWMVIKATRWCDVLKLARAVVIPVMLCDRELPGLDWPQGLGEFERTPRSPALVALADLAAGTLEEALAHYGAFDVLFRPLRREKLIAVVDLAGVYWEMQCGWAARAV
jgi:DNA-binding NtrC family response regulator